MSAREGLLGPAGESGTHGPPSAAARAPGRLVGRSSSPGMPRGSPGPPPPPAGEPDFSKKHPLETKWTLWFDNPNGKQKQATWGQTLRAVYTFDTVEDFWW